MLDENDLQRDAEQQPQPAHLRRLSPGLIALVVAVLAAVAVAGVFLVGGLGRAPLTGPGQKQLYSPERLDIPVVEISGIMTSVPVDSSAVQRRSLSVGVVVRFAPPEGERVDVRRLTREFMPRVNSLRAEFGSIIIEELNSKDYGRLTSADGRKQLLDGFKASFNKLIEKYGLDKMAVVDNVVWKDFNWIGGA